jgi:hypothetical protein
MHDELLRRVEATTSETIGAGTVAPAAAPLTFRRYVEIWLEERRKFDPAPLVTLLVTASASTGYARVLALEEGLEPSS